MGCLSYDSAPRRSLSPVVSRNPQRASLMAGGGAARGGLLVIPIGPVPMWCHSGQNSIQMHARTFATRRHGLSIGLTASYLRWMARGRWIDPVVAVETRLTGTGTGSRALGGAYQSTPGPFSSSPTSSATLQEGWPSRLGCSGFLRWASRRLVALLRLPPCHPQDCRPRRKCSNTCTTYSRPFM